MVHRPVDFDDFSNLMGAFDRVRVRPCIDNNTS